LVLSTKHSQGYREMVAIRYYLQWIIWECENRWRQRHHGVTNYKALLYLIRQSQEGHEPVIFVTFNYDTMLEEAIPTLGVDQIKGINDYINSSVYKVIKVHGSVNWGRVIRSGVLEEFNRSSSELLAQHVIRLADFIVEQDFVTREYEMIPNPEERDPNSRPLFPAIAIPMERKLEFVCPSDHIQELEKCLPQVSKLLVIGWRASDIPFLELLYDKAPSNIPVQVVCENTESCNQVIQNMDRNGLVNRYSYSNLGFTRYVISETVKKFLSD
jgi:hypothetical protein